MSALGCYADDTHITYAGADLNSTQSNLNRDLSNFEQMAYH